LARDAGFINLVVQYVYDEHGKRIQKMSYNSSYQLSLNTFYFGDVVFTQAVSSGIPGPLTVQEYQIDGVVNRLGLYYKQSNIYAYQMADHLGNVRAVIAQSGSTYQVRMYTDFYPFGMTISTAGTNDYRFGFQGQNAEKDNETNWNAFELRMYDSRIARWFQYDPHEQHFSPYQGMGNNPVNLTDPDGGGDDNFFKQIDGGGIFWSDDNEPFSDPTKYQDLGTWYQDDNSRWYNFGGGDKGIIQIPLNAEWTDEATQAWKNFYVNHDRMAMLTGGATWAPVNYGGGNYLYGNKPGNFHWGWNEAVDNHPVIYPVDILAAGLAGAGKFAAAAIANQSLRHTADQIALKELIEEASNGGRKALTKYEAEAAMQLAKDVNYPDFRYNPLKDGAIFNNHWETGQPHFHFPGVGSGHIPFVP